LLGLVAGGPGWCLGLRLGLSLRLLPPEGLNLIVAGALFSIAINPLIFRFVRTLERRTRVPAAEGHVASAQT